LWEAIGYPKIRPKLKGPLNKESKEILFQIKTLPQEFKGVGDTKDFTIPGGEIYNVIGEGKNFWVTDQWHKPGVPQLIPKEFSEKIDKQSSVDKEEARTPMPPFEKQVRKYKREAYDYYSSMKISPDPEDILEFIIQGLETERDYKLTNEEIAKVKETAGLTIEPIVEK